MTKTKLSEAQLRAIEYLALPDKGGLTYAEVAAEVGVDERTLRRWRSDDAFYEELKRKIIKDSAKDLPRVFASMPEHVISGGNAAMARIILQAHGMLSDKVEVHAQHSGGAVDVDAIRARMMAQAKAHSDGE
ncbi:phBC6A51 family helix-turn-helix protein [Sporosarcina highlanderae]|uniref:PhBC6A51 family helix-turn-helix protein n=1 Tax=Sporosarcina highlanderae TaxID=3035916 RepID=A0ABT8JU23_9BACL|nr:phBC6A51 family helix-turn-helix protein [Sporosarcina highlanderae]MDN4608648.1 phBC6A51 family helix-turn-helix protein [Sporosarcina highlanderae]